MFTKSCKQILQTDYSRTHLEGAQVQLSNTKQLQEKIHQKIWNHAHKPFVVFSLYESQFTALIMALHSPTPLREV